MKSLLFSFIVKSVITVLFLDSSAEKKVATDFVPSCCVLTIGDGKQKTGEVIVQELSLRQPQPFK